MTYVDGFVTPVFTDKLAQFKKMSRKAGKVFKEHGALSYVESIADDVPAGKTTDFQRAVKLKEREIVAFTYIVYKNRRSRDAIAKKVMADSRLKDFMDPKNLTFDGRRMIVGGFKPVTAL